MRELSPYHRSDLRHFFGRAEPVKPRHQRGVQACGNCNGGRRNGRTASSGAPSATASSTALVISSTNSGMPSVRSIMSCLMLSGSGLLPVTRSIRAAVSRAPRRLRVE